MTVINDLTFHYCEFHRVLGWLKMAVSMHLLLTFALLLLWFRFFDSHLKAYIYVMYLEILSKYGSPYVRASVFGTLIRSGMVLCLDE